MLKRVSSAGAGAFILGITGFLLFYSSSFPKLYEVIGTNSTFLKDYDNESFNKTTVIEQDADTEDILCSSRICGRCISQQQGMNGSTIQPLNFSSVQENIIKISGGFNVGTNNHLIALFNAMHFAKVAKYSMYIVANSWAHTTLKLFLDDIGIQNFKTIFGVQIVPASHNVFLNDTTIFEPGPWNLFYNKIRPGINSTQHQVEVLTREFLLFLWSNAKSTTCSSVKYFGLQNHTEPYTVIHSRWMQKPNNCLVRIKTVAERLWESRKFRLDQKAPCELPASYIRSILLQNNLLYGNAPDDNDTNETTAKTANGLKLQLSSSPIYVISDGFNPSIIKKLKTDPVIGHRILEVPDANETRWVLGDMMLGALSNVFIGTPTSTMSINIARSRGAFGFDGKTSYLFPLDNRGAQNNTDVWDFDFHESNSGLTIRAPQRVGWPKNIG